MLRKHSETFAFFIALQCIITVCVHINLVNPMLGEFVRSDALTSGVKSLQYSMAIARNTCASLPLLIAVIYGFDYAAIMIAVILVLSTIVIMIFENDYCESTPDLTSTADTFSLVYRECMRDYKFT